MRSVRLLPSLWTLLLLSGAGIGLGAVEAGDEDREREAEPDPREQEVLLEREEERLDLPAPDDRRDPFYSLVDELKAIQILAENEEEQKAGDLDAPIGPAPKNVDASDADQEREAVRFASSAVAEVEGIMAAEAWEKAMNAAEKRLAQVAEQRELFPRNERLKEAESLLKQYYILAEDRKLYEEARAQFEALGLRIEGLIWSADEPSLAIISGEPVARGVNERVRNATVIKNIDQNRVDFLYSYRQRQYHFQLYLEPKE